MWVVPTDLVVQRVLFYAADKADYQLTLFLAKQFEEEQGARGLVGVLLRSSYSIVEAIFAESLSLAVCKILRSGAAWSFVLICTLLAVSYGAIAFVKNPIVAVVVRFLQTTLLLMDSLALTQITQAM